MNCCHEQDTYYIVFTFTCNLMFFFVCVKKQLQKNQDASSERILIRVGIMRRKVGFKRRQFTVSIIIPSSLDASLQS